VLQAANGYQDSIDLRLGKTPDLRGRVLRTGNRAHILGVVKGDDQRLVLLVLQDSTQSDFLAKIANLGAPRSQKCSGAPL
jgi:hypothetical protein